MANERSLPDEGPELTSGDDPAFQTLIDLIPAGVIVCDARGTITMRNRAAEVILGMPITGTAFGPEDGYTVLRVDGSSFLPRELPLPRAIERGDVTHDAEILIRKADGAERTILVSASPIRDRSGQISGAIGVFQDVTEQRRTLRRLNTRELQQEAIANLGQEALAGTEISQLFVDAARLVAKTLNVEYATVLELLPNRTDLVVRAASGWEPGPAEHATVEGGAGSLAGYTLQSDHPVIVEDMASETRFRKGASYLTEHGVVSGISVIIAGHPRPFGVLGAYACRRCHFTVDDVNFVQSIGNVLAMAIERAHGEQAQAHLLAREQALAEMAQALVHERELAKVVDVVITQSQIILGADVVTVWLADPVHQELTLLSTRGISPTTVDLIEHLPYDSPSLATRAARECQPQILEDIPAIRAGSSLTYQVAEEEGMRTGLAVPLHNAHLVGVVAYMWREPRHLAKEELAFNMTIANLFAVAIENAHHNDQMLQALEVREEFMATAAHELRTPLTVIKGRAQMLLKSGAVNGFQRQLGTIVGNANRMSRTISDLLLAARLRPGLTALHLGDLDLKVLVQERIAALARGGRRITINASSEGPLTVRADRELVGEVVTRLIENALIYSKADQTVEVRVQRQGQAAVVSVVDNGVGILPERQPHVFEPFYQSVPAGAPGYTEAVSLGLHLCEEIVEAHGGRIWLTSTPGKGSTFEFSLPLTAQK